MCTVYDGKKKRVDLDMNANKQARNSIAESCMRRWFVQVRLKWRQLCVYDYGCGVVNATDMNVESMRLGLLLDTGMRDNMNFFW